MALDGFCGLGSFEASIVVANDTPQTQVAAEWTKTSLVHLDREATEKVISEIILWGSQLTDDFSELEIAC